MEAMPWLDLSLDRGCSERSTEAEVEITRHVEIKSTSSRSVELVSISAMREMITWLNCAV